MTQLKPYPKYKDSGVEWIGKIPEDWEVSRIKSGIRKVRNGIWGRDQQNDENDVYCIRILDFDRSKARVRENDFTIRNIPIAEQKQYLLNKGDLLIEKSGGGEKQPVGYTVLYTLNNRAVYTNFMAKMELRHDKISPLFMSYLSETIYAHRINVKSIKQTTGIQNLDIESYLNEHVIFPSLQNQEIIVSYLNEESNKIDSLISDKKRLIKLLEEKRQAIITETVTKGLDPDVKMKDSGIEWIGEIPEHWNKNKISRMFSIIGSGGTPLSTNKTYYNGNIPWLNTGDLNDGYLTRVNKKITQEALNDYSTLTIYPENSLVVAMYGATIGKISIIQIKTTVNQACCVLSKPKEVLVKFMFYWFLVNKEYIINQSSGGGQPNISQDIIKSLEVFYPKDKIEQGKIVECLDRKENYYNSLKAKINSQISKLQEYREALIYEAVTGKIDLRDYEVDSNEN